MARVSPTGIVAPRRTPERLRRASASPRPAWQIFEEDRKGSIKQGLLADFVILDKNPLTTAVGDIRDIKVLETIKEGRSAWQAKP